MKKILALILSAIIILALSACGESTINNVESESTKTPTSTSESAEMFKDADVKDISSEAIDATITLSGSSATISDSTRGTSGQTVTITSKGIYKVEGQSNDVTIKVADTKESGNIYLIFEGVKMTNSSAPCIQVDNAEKVIIFAEGDNSLSFGATNTETDGAIYSSDDLVINGDGNLSISSTIHGVVTKDDLKITGATIDIKSDSVGVKANDSVRIANTQLSIVSGHDGIQVENSDGTSFFYMESGSVNIESAYDGIDVGTSDKEFTGYVSVTGGDISITAGGGSGYSLNSKYSQKGIKCEGLIDIAGSNLNISSADDALNSNGDISISRGNVTLSSSDDGIHADYLLSISGGNLTVSKAYEGLEAYEINISGGTTSITASDDGLNAAGGSDSSSSEKIPSAWNPGGSGTTGTLRISGGNLYVNAQGDGLDSNGSIYISGGLIIVEGPTNGGNGAIDSGDGNGYVAEITGGTVLAIGSVGMATNFDSGTQPSALVSLSGGEGTVITVDDGSGFSFTASKTFQCLVYSSPNLKQGNKYTITAGSNSVEADFTSTLYYSTVSGIGGFGGMQGGPGGGPGGPGGGPGGH